MKKSDYLSVLTSCVACLPLTGCNSAQRGAEAAVRESLKDPDSARFAEFYYNEKTGKACLTVNAKNAMGGYTGDKQVSLRKDESGWSYEDENEWTTEDCRQLYADKAN